MAASVAVLAARLLLPALRQNPAATIAVLVMVVASVVLW
jgi:hypothetical protein